MADPRAQPSPEQGAPPQPAPADGEPAFGGDDTARVAETESRAPSAPARDLERPHRVGAWLVIVGSLALAALLVALPAHVYEFDFRGRLIARTRRLDVIELWRVQANNLPDIGQSGLIEALFIVCALVFVVGSAYLIWIATVEIAPPSSTSSPAAGRPGESEPA